MTTTRALALFVGLLACAFRVLALDRLENDHFVYIARGANVLAGDLPVRDFEDPGSVLMTAASAGASALAGGPVVGEVGLSAAAVGAAAAVTMIAAAGLTGSWLLGLWAAGLEIAVMPRLYAYPKLLVYAVASWLFVRYARRPGTNDIAAMGLLAAAGFLFRHDHAVYLTTGVAALLIAVHGRARERLLRDGLIYAGVAVCAVTPFLLYVHTVRGLGVYLDDAIRFSLAEARRAGSWGGDAPPLAIALIAIPPIAFAAAFVRRRGEDGRAAAALAIAVMLAAMEAGFLRDRLAARAADVIAPAAILAAWLTSLSARATRRRAAAIAAAAGALLLTAAAVRHGDTVDEVFDTRILAGPRAWADHVAGRLDSLRQAPPRAHAPSPELTALTDYIDRCTEPGDRVLVGWFAPEVPVLSRRSFAGGHAALVAGYYTSDEDQQLMIDRLQRGGGTLVLLLDRERAAFEGSWPALARHVASAYRSLGSIEPGVEVFAARARRARRYDPALGLACFR